VIILRTFEFNENKLLILNGILPEYGDHVLSGIAADSLKNPEQYI
jgi:hypothetical protein